MEVMLLSTVCHDRDLWVCQRKRIPVVHTPYLDRRLVNDREHRSLVDYSPYCHGRRVANGRRGRQAPRRFPLP